MVLKRKKKREYEKELKIFGGAFDERTLLTLYRLLNRGVFDEVVGVVKEGKESVVLSGLTKEKRWVAIKVYRTEACNFKAMWRYLVGDPRFLSIKKSRRAVVNIWCQREFKNLKTALKVGVSCPKPLAYKENVLVMEFLGKDGAVAPRLIDIKPRNPKKIYEKVLEDLKKLAKANLVHGDLSAYNVLLFDNEPYFIDLSHGTTPKSPFFVDFLRRDVKNINVYFAKLNVAVRDDQEIQEELLHLARRDGE